MKVLHSIYQQIWKTQPWPQNGNGQFSFQSQRKAKPKNVQTTPQLHSSHTAGAIYKYVIETFCLCTHWHLISSFSLCVLLQFTHVT